MLTSKPPFSEQDQLALVHCHIAKKVVPVNKINTNIPKVIADVISKLLQKNAEDRYQSAWGLAKDLQLISARFENDPSLTNFELPNVPEDYVHRIGRTGRAGKTGVAYYLVILVSESLLW